MPAKTKSDLLAATEKEYAKLEMLLPRLSEKEALLKREEDTSVKDVIAHRAHWTELFLGWYADGLAGKEVFFPAKGYKWNELKRYNAALREAQSELSFDEACALLKESYAELIALIKSLDDSELYGGPMKGAKNSWTVGRWAEAAGASHYRSASKYLRAVLRAGS